MRRNNTNGISKGVVRRGSGVSPMPGVPLPLDLPEATKQLLSNSEGDRVLTLSAVPIYIKVSFARVQRSFATRGIRIPTGAGAAACALYGLEALLSCAVVEMFLSTLERVETAEGLTLADQIELSTLVDAFEFTPLDAPKKGLKPWSLRTPDGAVARRGEDDRTGVKLTDGHAILRMRPSQLLVPCIARGLADQPGVHAEATDAMQEMFGALRDELGNRTQRLARILAAYEDADA